MVTLFGPDFTGQIPLTEHRVPRDQLVLDRDQVQQLQRGLVLIGLGVDGQFPQYQSRLVGTGRQQMHAGELHVGQTAKRFAVETDGGPPVGLRRRGDPARRRILERRHVQLGEHLVQRRTSRRRIPGEARGIGKVSAPFPAELGDGIKRSAAAQHRHRTQRQNRIERVTISLNRTRIGNSRKQSARIMTAALMAWSSLTNTEIG